MHDFVWVSEDMSAKSICQCEMTNGAALDPLQHPQSLKEPTSVEKLFFTCVRVFSAANHYSRGYSFKKAFHVH